MSYFDFEECQQQANEYVALVGKTLARSKSKMRDWQRKHILKLFTTRLRHTDVRNVATSRTFKRNASGLVWFVLSEVLLSTPMTNIFPCLRKDVLHKITNEDNVARFDCFITDLTAALRSNFDCAKRCRSFSTKKKKPQNLVCISSNNKISCHQFGKDSCVYRWGESFVTAAVSKPEAV